MLIVQIAACSNPEGYSMKGSMFRFRSHFTWLLSNSHQLSNLVVSYPSLRCSPWASPWTGFSGSPPDRDPPEASAATSPAAWRTTWRSCGRSSARRTRRNRSGAWSSARRGCCGGCGGCGGGLSTENQWWWGWGWGPGWWWWWWWCSIIM